jgi:hypothetical protein
MNDDSDDIKANFKKFKDKKKKLAVPTEFLEDAKSYEDKLTVVKILSEKEKGRVILMIKAMLKDAVRARDKK